MKFSIGFADCDPILSIEPDTEFISRFVPIFRFRLNKDKHNISKDKLNHIIECLNKGNKIINRYVVSIGELCMVFEDGNIELSFDLITHGKGDMVTDFELTDIKNIKCMLEVIYDYFVRNDLF